MIAVAVICFWRMGCAQDICQKDSSCEHNLAADCTGDCVRRKCSKPYVYVLLSVSNDRAVAPSPAGPAMAGPAMAGPVFAAGTKILNIEDMHFKHTLKLGGGYWPKVKQRSKSRVILLQT